MKTKPAGKCTPIQISQLKLLIANHIPTADIDKYDESFLLRSLNRRIQDTQCTTASEYIGLIAQSPAETGVFLNSMSISYSEFFRNALTFSVLERIVLPTLVFKLREARKNELRIWSAACAAGQESYSLAMLLEELKIRSATPFEYRIFATDHSPAQVNEARRGEYAAESLRNLSLNRAQHWFVKQGNKYTVKEALKSNIDFSVFDLFTDQFSSPPASIFGDFDLVLCANLLFYYKKEYQEMILRKTGSCLAKGGYFISGETEREVLISHHYREEFQQSAIFRVG
jgi:chemotaxis methyl-accepting protein methylase